MIKFVTQIASLETTIKAFTEHQNLAEERVKSIAARLETFRDQLKTLKEKQSKELALKANSWKRLPTPAYEVKPDANGRAVAFFNNKCIMSTISEMHATVDCWIHYMFGSVVFRDHNVRINWRRRPRGYVFWHYDQDGLCSKDFNTIEMAVRAAKFVATK